MPSLMISCLHISNLPITQACPKQRSVVTSRGKPLQHTDPSLPPGWHRELVKSSDSRWRVVIIGPDGRRFWSKSDIRKAFSGQGKGGIKWEEFNFSVYCLDQSELSV